MCPESCNIVCGSVDNKKKKTTEPITIRPPWSQWIIYTRSCTKRNDRGPTNRSGSENVYCRTCVHVAVLNVVFWWSYRCIRKQIKQQHWQRTQCVFLGYRSHYLSKRTVQTRFEFISLYQTVRVTYRKHKISSSERVFFFPRTFKYFCFSVRIHNVRDHFLIRGTYKNVCNIYFNFDNNNRSTRMVINR